jgi:hypothetical protein
MPELYIRFFFIFHDNEGLHLHFLAGAVFQLGVLGEIFGCHPTSHFFSYRIIRVAPAKGLRIHLPQPVLFLFVAVFIFSFLFLKNF